jgi:hypothetical protein
MSSEGAKKDGTDSLEWLLLDFLAQLEESARAARQKLQRKLEAELAWQRIEAPKPLNPEDRAIAWLRRKLEEITKAHPELKSELLTDSSGRITALRFVAPDSEVREDVASVATWAFEKAASRHG